MRQSHIITMSDFDFNEHIQDNAGYYGAVGGMMHLRNQDAQKKELQKQRKLLEEQARSAREQANSEKERLSLEKRRMELEEQERAFEKERKAQIKDIRKLMTVLSSELDDLEFKHL